MQAQMMGLVKMLPRSGVFVQSLDFSSLVDALANTLETALMQEDNNLFDLIEARRLIEVEVVGLAAARHRMEDLLPLRQTLDQLVDSAEDRNAFIQVDERFHLGLANMAGNPVLILILEALLALLRPHRTAMVPGVSAQQTRSRHEAIYRKVMDGDVEGAREALLEHLTEQRERLLDQLQEVCGPA